MSRALILISDYYSFHLKTLICIGLFQKKSKQGMGVEDMEFPRDIKERAC